MEDFKRVLVMIPIFHKYTRLDRDRMADRLAEVLVDLLLKAKFTASMYDHMIETFNRLAKEKRPEAIDIEESRRPYTTD